MGVGTEILWHLLGGVEKARRLYIVSNFQAVATSLNGVYKHMRRRPNDPDNQKAFLAVALFVLGLFCCALGIQVYRSPSLLPVRINPAEHDDPPYDPPYGTILLCIAGLGFVWMARRPWRDSRPIPNEVVPPPVQPVVGVKGGAKLYQGSGVSVDQRSR